MKLNKQTIIVSLASFAAVVAAIVVVYFVRSSGQQAVVPEPTTTSSKPTTAPVFEVTPTYTCSLGFEIPCTPGLTCASKKAYKNEASNTAGIYSYSNLIASGSVVEGNQTLVYSLAYENTGNTTVATGTFTDTLPANVEFVDADPKCSYAPSTRLVTCTLSNIAAGAKGTVGIRVKVKSSPTIGEFVNTAKLTPSAGAESSCATILAIASPSPSPSSTVTPSPSASVSPSPSPSVFANLDCLYKKVYRDDSRNRAGYYYLESPITDTSSLTDGQTIVYSIGMKNHGNAAASDVVITDVLSSSLTFIDADNGCSYEASSRRVTCTVGSLAGNVETARSIRVRIGVSSTTAIENTAEVFSTNGQRDACSVRVDASGKVVPPPSPSPVNVAQPTTLPTAGVFEVTAGTLGAGVLFLILGALGLLVL